MKPNNLMEIFTHLEKSNCRECGEKTCLSFAAAVFQSRKQINGCPHIDANVIALFADQEDGAYTEMGDDYIAGLKERLQTVDLSDVANRFGGSFDGNKLTIKIMGKDFSVTQDGEFITLLHVNPFVAVPFLELVINGKGLDPVGDWVSFRELKETAGFSYEFFNKRCELSMKRIADSYQDLFEDLVHIFGGRQVEEKFKSDVSVILYPFPKVPVMICYWGSEDGLESTLNLFFDKTIDSNLPGRGIFTACVGLAQMIERLSVRHAAFV